MRILFPSDFFDKKKVDADFAGEYEAAKEAGFDVQLFDVEEVDQGEYAKAIRKIPAIEQNGRKANCIMRGWMMRVEKYRDFYDALAEKGMRLINSWDRYAHTHHFPMNYKHIEGHTPFSIWVDKKIPRVLTLGGEMCAGWDFEYIMDELRVFDGAPIIVKDYVKSAKHLWHDACFIPDSSDDEDVARVLRNFIAARGSGFNVGFVFRQFETFEAIGEHPKSGIPRINEHRIFWIRPSLLERKIPLFVNKYWLDAPVIPGSEPNPTDFQHIADKISSDFFTMDVARKPDGTWMIIEIGDGQTAGLPSPTDDEAFYRALKAAEVNNV